MDLSTPTTLSDVRQLSTTSDPVSACSRRLSPGSIVRRALNIFVAHDLVAPEQDQLAAIVRLALKAQELYFAAAVYHPDETQLNHFFDGFVQLCAIPAEHI